MLKRLSMLWLVLCLILTALPVAAAPVPVNPTRVSLPKTAVAMKGRMITLTPVLTPVDATTTYTWSSDKKSVATVVGGVVTGVNPGKAVITVKTANKKWAKCTVTVQHVPMTGFTVSMADWQGYDCYYEEDGDEEACFYEVTGHRMYPTIGNIAPDDANPTIVWKSANTGVAAVDSKGIITCKKQGTTMVTGTSKYGGYKVSLPVEVGTNATYWSVDECFGDDYEYEYDEDYYYTSAKYVYVKSGYLYVDMYILNMNSFTIRRLSKQSMYFTFDSSETDYEDYDYIGSYKPTLKAKIPPYRIGLATFKLGKIDGSKVWLTDADAYCGGYAYSKDFGAEPKAAIPGISGVSRPARTTKPAA